MSIKTEIMSLGLDVKVIFCLRARNMGIAWDSTQSHISERIFWSWHTCQLQKRPHPIWELTYRATVELDLSLDPACII
jgi:hypothetical protein